MRHGQARFGRGDLRRQSAERRRFDSAVAPELSEVPRGTAPRARGGRSVPDDQACAPTSFLPLRFGSFLVPEPFVAAGTAASVGRSRSSASLAARSVFSQLNSSRPKWPYAAV